MITPTWAISTYNGATWVSDGTIPRPGISEVEESLLSTAEIVKLSDGSEAKITPQIKYNMGSMSFAFSRLSLTEVTRNKIINYAKNSTGLKLTTHFGYTYQGYLEESSLKWMLDNQSTQRFTQSIKFKLFDIDGTGVIISGTSLAL
jgi:hypothetical protein